MDKNDLFVFLHIPRTGGTTLNNIFSANLPGKSVLSLYSREDFAARSRIAELLPQLRLVQGHFLHDQLVENLTRLRLTKIISFIRHPVERLVSEYLFLKNWPHSQVYDLIRAQNLSFADYISLDTKEFRYRTKNLMTRIFSRLPFDGPPPSEAVPLAVENAGSYALIGLTEYFDESLLLLGDLMGLANLYYERQNALAQSLKEGVSQEDRALAAEYNQADLELYRILKADFEAKLAARPFLFRARLAKFKTVNAKMNKVMGLINERDGLDRGDILNPKRVWDYAGD